MGNIGTEAETAEGGRKEVGEDATIAPGGDGEERVEEGIGATGEEMREPEATAALEAGEAKEGEEEGIEKGKE